MPIEDIIAAASSVHCLFCKIAAGSIPANKVYEDDVCLAFYNIDH